MASNVFEVGNLILVKNAMGAKIWEVEHRSEEACRVRYVKTHYYQTDEKLPCRKPVVFLGTGEQDPFGRNFVKILGPNGMCYVRKEAFL